MTEYYLMHKRPLAVIAVFFILGIVLVRFLPDWIEFIHVFVATLIFILISFVSSGYNISQAKACGYRFFNVSNIFLLLSISSFASLLYLNSKTFSNNHISHFLKEEKLKANIVGIIKSPALTRRPYFGKINSTYIFELEAIKDNGEWWEVNGLSQIRIR